MRRARAWNRLRRALSARRLPVWYHPDYRLPLGGLELSHGLEPRRADHVAWYLLEVGAIDKRDVRTPERATYADLARVHGHAWLESLGRPETLAAIFGVSSREVDLDATMNLVRRAVGGTLAAAREALLTRGPTLNLQGGFHHAFPDKGGGLCAVNDLAVAVAGLRDEGFEGRVVILDLDAHPPDGTHACLQDDPDTWIGSISGADWGALPGVDETVLPRGAGDVPYLEALSGLLARMPRPALAFVLAGGDVLAGDRFGVLGLSLDGARRRDLAVAEALSGLPSVWLPGGGYSPAAWRALAGTGLALALRSDDPLPPDIDPLEARMSALFASVNPGALGQSELTLDESDLAEALGMARADVPMRLLGYYTAEGLEYALHHYGVLTQIERLGFRDLRVVLDRADVGERFRLLGRARDDGDGREHTLVESVLERQLVRCPLIPGVEGSGPDGAGVPLLYVHWLTLRNPRASFTASRPALPGQDAPGLGMAPEASELLDRMATRLGLAGVALRPAWYHVAYASRGRFHFLDPARQGRFEALVRDLAGVPLLRATCLVAEGRVRLNGAPYHWEPDLMVSWRLPAPQDAETVAAARASSRFSVDGRDS